MTQLLLIPQLLLQRESDMSQHRILDKIQQLTEKYQQQVDTFVEEKVIIIIACNNIFITFTLVKLEN